MPSAYSIPLIYEEEIEGAVAAGYYSNKSEVVRDALREFFESKKNVRVASAVEMFKKGRITLARASELAGLNLVEFKETLKERGINSIISSKGSKERKMQLNLIKKIRQSS